MKVSPKFVVLHKLKGNKQNSIEKGVKINMLQRKGPMSQHCFSKFPISRHYVEKVLKLWQRRDINWRKESTNAEMSRHHKKALAVKLCPPFIVATS